MSATMSMTNIMRHNPRGTACGSLDELNMFENPWAPLLPQPAEAPSQLSKPAQTLRFLNFTNPDQSRSKSNRRLVRSVASKYSGRPLQAHKDKDKGKDKEKERGRGEEREKDKEKVKEKEQEKEKQTETTHKENTTAAPKFRKGTEHTRASLTGVFSSDGVGHPFSKIRKQPSGRRNSLVVSPTKFKSASGDPFGVFPVKAASKEMGLVSSYLRLLADPTSVYFKAFECPIVDRMLIPLALSQPILYHSLVYTATAHFFGIDHKLSKPFIISLEHGYRAIQLVQKNLHTVPAISDETAFATALLGVTEFLHGESLRSLAHFRGLAQMVKLKGSIGGFENLLLRNLLNWLHGVGLSSLRSSQNHLLDDSTTSNIVNIMLALLELAPLSYSTFEQTVQLFNSLVSTLVPDPEFMKTLVEFMQLKVLDLATYDPKEFSIASDQTIIYPSIWKGSENCIKPCNLAKKLC